jgi:hypothetical protein
LGGTYNKREVAGEDPWVEEERDEDKSIYNEHVLNKAQESHI